MFTFLADVEDDLPSEPRSLGLLCFLSRENPDKLTGYHTHLAVCFCIGLCSADRSVS